MNEEPRESERHLAAATMLVLASLSRGAAGSKKARARPPAKELVTTHGNGPGRLRLLQAGVAGALALAGIALYLRFELSLPRGPVEFVPWPPLEPLPFAALRGFSYEQLARHAGRLVTLLPACAAASWALFLALGDRARLPRGPALRQWTIGAVAASVLLSILVAAFATRGRALVDDELVYAQQAELLLDGRLAEAEVPAWAWEPFTIDTARGRTGKYLFGEPLVQMAGVALGFPALLHFPLLLLTLLVWWRQLSLLVEPAVARWSTVALAISPMVVMTTATGLSQATSLACLALAGLGATWIVVQRHEISGAVLVASALGFGVSVRAQSVVPMGAVLLGWVVYATLSRRRIFPLVLVAVFGAPWAFAVAAYNRALTGSAFELPWSLFHPLERYGFGQPLAGDDFVHGAWTAIENLGVMAVRFNGWWLGWPLSLAVVGGWWVCGLPRDGARIWLWAGAGLVAFHVPYYSTGISETGPIYLYELSLPLSLVAAWTLRSAQRRWARATAAVVIVHLVVGTATFYGEHMARLRREVGVVHDPIESVLREVTPPALLLYELAPQENLRLGWITGGFPKRWRRAESPIVTYPRGDGAAARALIRHFADRSCWYYRVDPAALRPEVRRCAEVPELIDRPLVLEGPAIAVPSTAMRKGLLDPFARRRADAAGD